MNNPLSQRLRTETRDAHTRAERSGIMHDLLKGTITRDQYVALLENLEHIYVPLEHALDANASVPELSFIDLKQLRRAPSLRRDIEYLRGASPDTSFEPKPAAQQYAERIQEISKSAPILLGAHAYLRYVGDLSGGQILRRVVSKSLGLSDSRGAEFYEFPDIAEPDAFKHRFRASIDSLSSDDNTSDQIIAETLRGFELHEQLFTQLAG